MKAGRDWSWLITCVVFGWTMTAAFIGMAFAAPWPITVVAAPIEAAALAMAWIEFRNEWRGQ